MYLPNTVIKMVRIRSLKDDDINVVLEFTGQEGWGFSDSDLRATLEVDRDGLLVAEDDVGKPIGCIGCFNMAPDIAYVNLFIVRKDMRDKGIGKTLWTTMLKNAGNRIRVLDSVSHLKEWYKKQGFIYEAFSVKGFKGMLNNEVAPLIDPSYKCVPLTSEMIPELFVYDQKIYGCSREKVLRAWYCGSDKYSFVALDDNSLVGYASYYIKYEKEWFIRALYVDNDVIADELLVKILSNIPKGIIIRFVMLGDKTLPKYFRNFKSTGTECRLSTKEICPLQMDKMIINSKHTI